MFAHFFKDLQTEHASIVVKPTRDYKVNFECMFSPFSVVYSACYSVCGWLSALLFKRFTKWAPKCTPKSMQCHLAILIEVALCTSLNQLTCWRRCFYLPSLHHCCTLFLWLFASFLFGEMAAQKQLCVLALVVADNDNNEHNDDIQFGILHMSDMSSNRTRWTPMNLVWL